VKTICGIIGAFALTVGFAPGIAVAQGLPGGANSLNETHGNWTVACSAPEGEARCTILQNQVSGENRQRLLAVELRATEGGSKAEGMLVLPFGLSLEDGVALYIDEAEALPPLRFSTCLPLGCLVPLDLDADVVSALRAGGALVVQVVASETGQEISFSISLTGFTSALARIAELSGA